MPNLFELLEVLSFAIKNLTFVIDLDYFYEGFML